MSISGINFLGLSCTNFNCSVGWGSDASQLNVGLVQDTTAGDLFTSPLAGTPVQFELGSGLGDWRFGGIIQKHTYSQSSAGKVYNVTVTDPREILSGVCLILNSYNGNVLSTPNLINVFQYWESTGFGNSQVNETGIPWKKVRDAVLTIVNGTSITAFGGPITLYNWSYKIALTGLPPVPDDFRISGDNISLLDFIDQVCQAGACDYFFTLLPGDIITLNTIPRTNAPTLGLISTWINSLDSIVSSETGLEFRNEVAGKFLVGGPRQDMYFQDYRIGISGAYSDDAIWPFWGYTSPGFTGAGNVILGQDINNEHRFIVDARHVNLNFPGAVVDTYTMCVGELRAALDSQNTWESYLWFRDNEPTIGSSGYRPTSDMYRGRATKLKLIGNVNADAYAIFKNATKDIVLSQQTGLSKKQLQESSLSWDTKHEEEIKRLYDLVHGYATEFYGRKFMVRIPTVESVRDPITNKTKFSLEPTSYGFLDESVWDDAVLNNYLPPDVNPLLNEEGLFQAYARYDNAAFRDFSEVSPNDVVFNSGGTSAFVKCDVEPGVAFLNYLTNDSPRAIVNVRGAVRTKVTGSGTDFGGAFGDLIEDMISIYGTLNSGDRNFITRQFSADQICLSNKGFIVQPDMVAVPLQSNINRYGPWVAVGANGKCEFIVDDTLVPWNYNGYTGMNLVGSGRVQDAYSNMLWAETGSVEIPGFPATNLGSAVIAGGPYVTDINVSMDANAGVTTRYNLSTWSPRFGSANKLKEKRIQDLTQFNQRQKQFNRTILRKAQQQRPPTDAYGYIIEPERTPRRQSKSTNTMIVGENIPYRSGTGYWPNVGIQPGYLTGAQLHPEEYENKAAASLDALFRPFSTNPYKQPLLDAGGWPLPLSSGYTLASSGYRLPHYGVPTGSGDDPGLYELDPYQSGFDIGIVVRGTEFPTHLNISQGGYDPSGNYRSMGHRFPMIGVGWGYDVDGKPVPNIADPVLNSGLYAASGLLDEFYPGYLSRPDTWKAAPVDIRYDYTRGIWVTGGGSNTKIVKLVNLPSGLLAASGYPSFPTRAGKNVYYAQEYTPTFNNIVGEEVSGSGITLTGTTNFLYVGNFRSNLALVDSYYFAEQINGKYYLDNQSVFL